MSTLVQKASPNKQRHPHGLHAGSAHFQDGDEKIDPGHGRADTGDLEGPYPIVHPGAGAVLYFGQRGISRPSGLGKLTHPQRYHDQHRPGGGEPETERIHKGKGDIAGPDLLRHHDIHQPDQKRHGHEDDHDRAVGAEDLIEVLRGQIAQGAARGHGLLRAHQNGIGEPAQQHDQGEDNVHDADLFGVEAGQPFLVKVGPLSVVSDQAHDHQAQENRANYGAKRDHIVIRNRCKA